jgi:hypothetical protein
LLGLLGEQQNERYDLSKQVNKIDVEAVEEADGVYFVDIELSSGTTENLEVENGIIREGSYKGQRLEDVIGKEYTEKILSTPKGESVTLQGEDLKLVGKGMKGFYDNIVPSVAKALIKELTGKEGVVEEVKIEERGQQAINITPELRSSVRQGVPLFQKVSNTQNLEGSLQLADSVIKPVKDRPGTLVLESGKTKIFFKDKVNPDGRVTNMIELDLIETEKGARESGSARKAIQDFLEYTDSLGKDVYLFASPRDSGTTTEGLIKFYSSVGFRSTSEFLPEEMIRRSKRFRSAPSFQVQDSAPSIQSFKPIISVSEVNEILKSAGRILDNQIKVLDLYTPDQASEVQERLNDCQ